MIPSRDRPDVRQKRVMSAVPGAPAPGCATLFPRLTRHTEHYPHYKGLLNIDNVLYYMAVWKRETERDGVRYPLLTMQIRHQKWELQKQALADCPPRGSFAKNTPSPGHGIAFPKIHRASNKYPNYKGTLNVFGSLYAIVAWRLIYHKDTAAGERLTYPMLRMKATLLKRADPTKPRRITEPDKPAYLFDVDSHRRYLLDERHDVAADREQYEYERQQEFERKRGAYI